MHDSEHTHTPCKDMRVHGHTTTAINDSEYTPTPKQPYSERKNNILYVLFSKEARGEAWNSPVFSTARRKSSPGRCFSDPLAQVSVGEVSKVDSRVTYGLRNCTAG